MIMRTWCCYQLCLAADHCAADTMPAFTHSHWQQTHGHSIFAGLGGMRSQGKEGGTKCKKEMARERGGCEGGMVRKARQ